MHCHNADICTKCSPVIKLTDKRSYLTAVFLHKLNRIYITTTNISKRIIRPAINGSSNSHTRKGFASSIIPAEIPKYVNMKSVTKNVNRIFIFNHLGSIIAIYCNYIPKKKYGQS
jgi:hypothetical protein